MWVLKKLVVHFGVKSFAQRILSSWWTVLEKFGREREEALLPGPIKGLAQFLLRIDTKVSAADTVFICDFTHHHTDMYVFMLHSPLFCLSDNH